MKQAIVFLAIIIAVSLTPFAQTPKTTIIWNYNPPTHDVFAVDGAYYRKIIHNDLVVLFLIEYNDKFFIADVIVANNSDNQILVDPRSSVLTLWRGPDKKADIFSPIPPEKIAKDITRRARRASTARIFAGAFSEATTGNRDVQQQVGQRNAEMEAEAAGRAAYVVDGALKANTLLPDSYVFGTVYFQRKKYDGGHFAIQIGDTAYNFPILPLPKQ